jgi:hypothetical protein
MITIGILGILVSIAAPHYILFREKARIARDIMEMNGIRTSIAGYMAQYELLPLPQELYKKYWKCDPPGPYRLVLVNQPQLTPPPPQECLPQFPTKTFRCNPISEEYALNLWRISHSDNELAIGYFVISQTTDHNGLAGDFVYSDDRTPPTVYNCP